VSCSARRVGSDPDADPGACGALRRCGGDDANCKALQEVDDARPMDDGDNVTDGRCDFNGLGADVDQDNGAPAEVAIGSPDSPVVTVDGDNSGDLIFHWASIKHGAGTFDGLINTVALQDDCTLTDPDPVKSFVIGSVAAVRTRRTRAELLGVLPESHLETPRAQHTVQEEGKDKRQVERPGAFVCWGQLESGEAWSLEEGPVERGGCGLSTPHRIGNRRRTTPRGLNQRAVGPIAAVVAAPHAPIDRRRHGGPLLGGSGGYAHRRSTHGSSASKQYRYIQTKRRRYPGALQDSLACVSHKALAGGSDRRPDLTSRIQWTDNDADLAKLERRDSGVAPCTGPYERKSMTADSYSPDKAHQHACAASPLAKGRYCSTSRWSSGAVLRRGAATAGECSSDLIRVPGYFDWEKRGRITVGRGDFHARGRQDKENKGRVRGRGFFVGIEGKRHLQFCIRREVVGHWSGCFDASMTEDRSGFCRFPSDEVRQASRNPTNPDKAVVTGGVYAPGSVAPRKVRKRAEYGASVCWGQARHGQDWLPARPVTSTLPARAELSAAGGVLR